MRTALLSATLLALTAPVAIHAQAAPKFSTAAAPVSELVANPAAKAVLEKHLPQLMQYADQIGSQTLKQLQGMAQGMLSDELLAKIDADLAAIK